MKGKQIPVWAILVCLALSCALCIWAWLFSWQLLLVLPILPAFFLQVLIRRGGTEWRWLLSVHAVILLGAVGIGGLILLLGRNKELAYVVFGLLLVAGGVSALVGCLLEWIIHRVRSRKD